MAEKGLTGATMDEIAKRAGVGKDSLYRRWSSKGSLAVDLIDTMASEAVRPGPVDPDPRLNLLLYLKDIVRLNQTTEFGPLVASVVGSAARDDDMAASFRSFWQQRRTVAASLVRDVVGPDLSDDDMELMLDALLGPVYYRLLVTGAELSDEYLWDLIGRLPFATDHDLDPSQSPQVH